MEYVDEGQSIVARVDGAAAQLRVPIRLRPLSLIEIGDCRFCVEPLPDDTIEPRDGIGGIGIVRAIVRAPYRQQRAALLDLVNLGVKLADEVAATIIELKERQLHLGAKPFESSLLQRSWNICEIADYLLDPSAPNSRFSELRRCLLDLTQRQSPLSGRRGQA
jgi:hypothetical protein